MSPDAVPSHLQPRSYRIFLQDLELLADIGLHEFEIGHPQRLLVSIEVWVDQSCLAQADAGEQVWDYDFIRNLIRSLAAKQRFNLQETLCRAIYDGVAARHGVQALRVLTRKPDVYPDCKAVGVELSSVAPCTEPGDSLGAESGVMP